MPIPFTYDEPTVMWRMRRGESLTTHAILRPRGPGAWVTWYVNDHPIGVREFDDWSAALQWSDRMQFQNWTAGWRPVPEYDDVQAGETRP
jgi:hypothetical protein